MSASPAASADARKRTVILTLGTVIVLAMTYGSGMRAEQHKIKKINDQFKVAKSDLRVAQMDLRASQALTQQLEARRQIDLALTALDQRNFGTAQDRLTEASARLSAIEAVNAYAKAHPIQTGDTPYQPPVSTLDLSSLAAQLKAITVPTTTDPGAERQEIQKLAAQLDESLGQVVPKADTPLAPVTLKPPTLNDVPETPGNDVTRAE